MEARVSMIETNSHNVSTKYWILTLSLRNQQHSHSSNSPRLTADCVRDASLSPVTCIEGPSMTLTRVSRCLQCTGPSDKVQRSRIGSRGLQRLPDLRVI